MPSQSNLIKKGVRYSDLTFDRIKKKLRRELEYSSDLEDFLNRTKDFTLSNPLIATGFQNEMSNIIRQGGMDTRFIRASQRELVHQTIDNYVGQLITNVGDDIKNNVRDIVKRGFDEGLHSREISKQIDQELDIINRTRARTIARTEINRARTISDYVVNRERGASGFQVVCRPDCCELCAEAYADITGEAYDELQEDGNDGHLITGVNFDMSDTDMLPPFHPNCRCSVVYQYNNQAHNDLRSQIHIK